MGRLEEAVTIGRRSYELDPLTPLYISAYADPLIDIGDYAAAESFHSMAAQQGDDYKSAQLGLLDARMMQGRYDAALLQVNDPTSGLYDVRELLTTLIDYARGKVTSIPEVSSDPKTYEEYLKKFYTAVVLMQRGEVDAVINIGDQGDYYWKKRFFSKLWDRDHL